MLVPIFWGCQRGLATCQCRAFSTATALQHQLLQQASQGSSEHAVQVLHPLDVPARLSNEGPATLHDRHPEGVPHSLDAQLLVSSRAAVAAATAATGAATQHAQHSAPRTQQHELQDAIKPGSVQHSSPAGLSTVSEQQAKAVGGFRTGVTTLPAGTGCESPLRLPLNLPQEIMLNQSQLFRPVISWYFERGLTCNSLASWLPLHSIAVLKKHSTNGPYQALQRQHLRQRKVSCISLTACSFLPWHLTACSFEWPGVSH